MGVSEKRGGPLGLLEIYRGYQGGRRYLLELTFLENIHNVGVKGLEKDFPPSIDSHLENCRDKNIEN